MFIRNRSLMSVLPCLAGFLLAFSGCGTALQRAAKKGRTEKVLTLLKKKPGAGKLNKALFEAATNGQDGAVNALLDAGADINYASGMFSLSPLMSAAYHLHPRTVKLLLSRGADSESAMKKLDQLARVEPSRANQVRRLVGTLSMIRIPDTEENRDKVQECRVLNDPLSSSADAEQLKQCVETVRGYEINTTAGQARYTARSGCKRAETNFVLEETQADGSLSNHTYGVQFCPAE